MKLLQFAGQFSRCVVTRLVPATKDLGPLRCMLRMLRILMNCGFLVCWRVWLSASIQKTECWRLWVWHEAS